MNNGNEKQTCFTCMFYSPTSRTGGECRANSITHTGFPPTSVEKWCGKWYADEELQKEMIEARAKQEEFAKQFMAQVQAQQATPSVPEDKPIYVPRPAAPPEARSVADQADDILRDIQGGSD